MADTPKEDTEDTPQADIAQVGSAQTDNAQAGSGQAGSGQIGSARQFRRFALAVCLVGVAVQMMLTAYYLSVGHAARPHDLPVGLIATEANRAQVTAQMERGGSFAVTDFPDAAALTTALRRREVYGGVDVTAAQPHLYVAAAAGPAASSVLRTTYTGVVQKQAADQLADLAAKGSTIAVAQAQALIAPPPITDVVPLPADDSSGASLGFLTQALALGGTIASVGLGRLIPRTRRSWKRGVGHLATLIVYALGSAGVVLLSMSWFGVGAGAGRAELFGVFGLVSLAITGSTAGAVALFGPPGALVGALYFTVGTVVSGASILPEFLPTFGRRLGESLPTGAGVQAVRDNLYFPDAPLGHPLTVLGFYAGIGCLVVLVTNILSKPGDGVAEFSTGRYEQVAEGSTERL